MWGSPVSMAMTRTTTENTARVKVILSECLESCAMDPQATCEATTDGDTVTVTASGSYGFVPPDEGAPPCASSWKQNVRQMA